MSLASAEGSRHPLLGIVLIVGTGFAFATMDTTIRHLSATLPVLVLLCARYSVQAAMMALWFVRPGGSGRSGFASQHPRFQLARGLLLLGSSAMGFLGLAHLPVPEFTSIALLTPVLVTLLSAWLLHEKVAPARWALVLGAFIGALIVVRPGSGLFGWVVLYPLASACCYASFQVLTARLSGLEDPLTTHFWTGFVGTAVVVPALLLVHGAELAALAAAMPASHWALLLLVGTLGGTGHLMLIYAFGLARPATLMPFTYVQIGSAALLGWLVFAHLPDRWGWIGMGVIAACGAASAWMNVRAAARKPSAVEVDTIAE